MRGLMNVKFVSAKHAQETYQYRNTKEKLYKANAAIWYDKICKFHPDPASKLSAHLYDIYHCCVYSEKLLMVDRGTVRNM